MSGKVKRGYVTPRRLGKEPAREKGPAEEHRNSQRVPQATASEGPGRERPPGRAPTHSTILGEVPGSVEQVHIDGLVSLFDQFRYLRATETSQRNVTQ